MHIHMNLYLHQTISGHVWTVSNLCCMGQVLIISLEHMIMWNASWRSICRAVIEPSIWMFKLGLFNYFQTLAEIELITELDNLFKLC